ncbi:hypothetical protein TWF694_001173 [Orbilia ellipsospora]|uniref:Uncharacterized protein n=1 Tax=Orbilia ellipsospora TaxID=2528407 RepID=A0AAV9XQW2_9PEZI
MKLTHLIPTGLILITLSAAASPGPVNHLTLPASVGTTLKAQILAGLPSHGVKREIIQFFSSIEARTFTKLAQLQDPELTSAIENLLGGTIPASLR